MSFLIFFRIIKLFVWKRSTLSSNLENTIKYTLTYNACILYIHTYIFYYIDIFFPIVMCVQVIFLKNRFLVLFMVFYPMETMETVAVHCVCYIYVFVMPNHLVALIGLNMNLNSGIGGFMLLYKFKVNLDINSRFCCGRSVFFPLCKVRIQIVPDVSFESFNFKLLQFFTNFVQFESNNFIGKNQSNLKCLF